MSVDDDLANLFSDLKLNNGTFLDMTSLSECLDNVQYVNLNTASKQELLKIVGIGNSTAESIIKYRQCYGSFQSVDELLEIRRVGGRMGGERFAMIRSHLIIK